MASAGDPIRFHHVKGQHIELFENGFAAQRVESFNQGLCFTNRRLSPNEKLLIQITKTCRSWTGTLRIGMTQHDPAELQATLPKYLCPDLSIRPGNWGKALKEQHVLVDSEIVMFYNNRGLLIIQVNGMPEEEFIMGMRTETPLFALFDVYGNTTGIRIKSLARTEVPKPLPEPRPVAMEVIDESEPIVSRAFPDAAFTRFCFYVFRDEKVVVNKYNARALSEGHALVVSDTVIKGGQTAVIRFQDLRRAVPIQLALSTETPERILGAASLDELIDSSYTVEFSSETPTRAEEVAIAISDQGAVSISQENRRWHSRIHVDPNVNFRLIVQMNNLHLLESIGLCTVQPSADAVSAPKALGPIAPSSAAATECTICLESPREVLINPCNHFVLCQNCASSLMSTANKQCPVCRAVIQKTLRIYMN